MVNNNMKYLIITPVKNEEKNIKYTIDSVINQTIKPINWIIVDDGSTDNTKEIIANTSNIYPWINTILLETQGKYNLSGGGEIKAFYKGLSTIDYTKVDFIGKVDGDVSFDKNYFKDLMEKFLLNENIGIASGVCRHFRGKKLIEEKVHFKHVRGAARLYRVKCWKDMGGTFPSLGWDAADVYKARMLGWKTYSFSDLPVVHHVETWTKGGKLKGKMRSAKIEYCIGSLPFFVLLKAIREIFRPPFIISSLFYIAGYIKPYLKKEKRIVSIELMDYIRNEQKSRIFNFFRREQYAHNK